MLDETFAESLAHKPAPFLARLRGFSGHTVIGKRLRPYTFWVAANLDFVQSPFMGYPCKSGTPSFGDIYIATKCAQLRFPSTIRIPRIDYEISAWRYGRRFARDIKYRFETVRDFSNYVKDYNSEPERVTSDNAKPVALPWYLYHVAMLVKHAGFTQKQAWESEIGWGQWWVTAMLTASGHNIELVTPEDRQQLAEMEAEQNNSTNGAAAPSPRNPRPGAGPAPV